MFLHIGIILLILNSLCLCLLLAGFGEVLPLFLVANILLASALSVRWLEFSRTIDAWRAQLESMTQSGAYRDLDRAQCPVALRTFKQALEHLLADTGREIQRLKSQAVTDPLTGCGNRRLLELRSPIIWNLCQRRQWRITVITFDLDNFKSYNDAWGHTAGDEALRQFGRLLRRRFARGTDVVTRLGGDEFRVVTHDQEPRQSLRMCQWVMKQLSTLALPLPDSDEILTCSAGLATCIPSPDQCSLTLFECSDSALYRAKAEGRNRLVLAHTPATSVAIPA